MFSLARFGNARSWVVVVALAAPLVSVGCGSAVLKNSDGGSGGTSAAGKGGSAGAGGGNANGGGAGGGAAGGSFAGAGGAGPGGATGAAGSAGGRATTGAAGSAGAGGAGGANPCANGVKDGTETDVDCGGGTCPECHVNKACAADGDCTTGSCSHLYCALASGPPNWLPGPSLNDGRGLAAVAIEPLSNENMLMLAIGGRDDSDSSDPPVSSSYELLDTAGSPPFAWQAPVALPSGIAAPAVTDAAGTILMFLDAATWSYTGAAGWTMLSTATPMEFTAAAAALGTNGLVYLVGTSDATSSSATEAYDPTMNKWTTGLKPMPTARFGLGLATGTDGRVYAIGGVASGATGVVEAYSVGTDTWSSVSALPDNTGYPGVASAPDGRIYSLGGETETGLLSTVNAYAPTTNRWAPVAPLSIARMGIGAAISPDGHLYAVGGTTNVEVPGEMLVEVYGPVVSVSPQAAAPGTSAAVSGSNFAASATVGIYFGSATGTPLATGTTDASGALTAPINFAVPNLAAGDVALIVMDDRSQFPITIDFRVQ